MSCLQFTETLKCIRKILILSSCYNNMSIFDHFYQQYKDKVKQLQYKNMFLLHKWNTNVFFPAGNKLLFLPTLLQKTNCWRGFHKNHRQIDHMSSFKNNRVAHYSKSLEDGYEVKAAHPPILTIRIQKKNISNCLLLCFLFCVCLVCFLRFSI